MTDRKTPAPEALSDDDLDGVVGACPVDHFPDLSDDSTGDKGTKVVPYPEELKNKPLKTSDAAKSTTSGSKAEFQMYSNDVKFEAKSVARFGDLATRNTR